MNKLIILIKNFLKPGETLSQKVVRSTFWVASIKITERIFRFVRTIILARLLAPADFGLFGIACLAMNMMDTFTQPGVVAALIQKKEKTEEFLDTAWTIGVIRGTILAILLFVCAPLIGQFFESAEVVPFAKILAIILFLNGLRNIGTVYFTKELDFRKTFVSLNGKTLINIAVAIPLAFILRSAWALLWAMLAGSVAELIFSYILHPYRPRLKIDINKLRELLGFGKWIFASSILIFLITQGDDILVGKLLGLTALGFYQMAYTISNLPTTQITHVISQVTFPAYSKLQDNVPKLREAYLKVLHLTAFIAFPIAGLIFALAPDLTSTFLGAKWMPIVPSVRILALFGAIRSISATFGPIFQGFGIPRISTKLQCLQFLVMSILIYPLTVRWGIVGTSLAVACPALIAAAVGSYIVNKVIKVNVWNFYWKIIPSIFNASILVLFVFFIKSQFSLEITLFRLFLFTTAGCFVYLALAYLFDIIFNGGIQQLIKKSILSLNPE